MKESLYKILLLYWALNFRVTHANGNGEIGEESFILLQMKHETKYMTPSKSIPGHYLLFYFLLVMEEQSYNQATIWTQLRNPNLRES